MKGIGDYLSRFKNLKPSDAALKQELRAIIKEVLGIDVSESDITVSRWTISIAARPALKGEIFQKSDLIYEKLQTFLPDRMAGKYKII